MDSDVAVYKSEIESCVQWCEEHDLVLHVKKRKEMVFNPRSIGDHSAVFVNEERVEQVTVHKYLGIHFDSQLHWARHVDYVCSRVSQCLRLRVHGSFKGP